MSSKKPLVLVADDSDEMREVVTKLLKSMRDPSFEVIEASDGEQALDLARRKKPDLVVLDVYMPEVSGWEVCKKIREDHSLAHTSVVILTGIGEHLNQLTSPLYGADAYIDKPFEVDDFNAKVHKALSARAGKTNGVVGAAKAAPKRAGKVVIKDGPGVKKAKPKKSAPAAKKVAKKSTPKKVIAKKAAPKKAAANPAKKIVSKKASKPTKKVAPKKASKPTKKAKKR